METKDSTESILVISTNGTYDNNLNKYTASQKYYDNSKTGTTSYDAIKNMDLTSTNLEFSTDGNHYDNSNRCTTSKKSYDNSLTSETQQASTL